MTFDLEVKGHIGTSQSSSSAHHYQIAMFPNIFKLLDILLTLPVGTATLEHSFSQMKMVKTRLRSRLNDVNLARLMRIAIEGSQLSTTYFNEILDIFKETNHRILL